MHNTIVTTQPSLEEARSIVRTMKKSQKKKQEIIDYITKHNPELLDNPHRSQRVKDCCNILRFINYWKWKRKLFAANFCKYDKFCLACATRRSIKKIQTFLRGIEHNNLWTKNWYHMTLTIRHKKTDTLEYLLDRVIKHRKQLMQKVRNKKRKESIQNSFFAKFNWMASSVEVTHGKNGRHPHIHIVACSDEEIEIYEDSYLGSTTNKNMQNERKKITKDSFSVTIRKIDLSDDQFSRKGLGETFKYAVKFSSLSIPKLVELISLQKKKQYRFYSTSWILRGRKIPKQEYQKNLLSSEFQKTQILIWETYTYNNSKWLYQNKK